MKTLIIICALVFSYMAQAELRPLGQNEIKDQQCRQFVMDTYEHVWGNTWKKNYVNRVWEVCANIIETTVNDKKILMLSNPIVRNTETEGPFGVVYYPVKHSGNKSAERLCEAFVGDRLNNADSVKSEPTTVGGIKLQGGERGIHSSPGSMHFFDGNEITGQRQFSHRLMAEAKCELKD